MAAPGASQASISNARHRPAHQPRIPDPCPCPWKAPSVVRPDHAPETPPFHQLSLAPVEEVSFSHSSNACPTPDRESRNQVFAVSHSLNACPIPDRESRKYVFAVAKVGLDDQSKGCLRDSGDVPSSSHMNSPWLNGSRSVSFAPLSHEFDGYDGHPSGVQTFTFPRKYRHPVNKGCRSVVRMRFRFELRPTAFQPC